MNLKILPKKLIIWGIVVLLLLSLLIYIIFNKMTNNKSYILIAVIALIVGGTIGWFMHKPETKILSGTVKIEYRDTCIESKILCTLTTKDSLSIYRIVRAGLKTTSTKVEPKVESEKPVAVTDTPVELKERVYTKYMNNGVTEVWDTIKVLGEIKDWKRAHKTDDVVEVQEKHTTTTAVVENGKDDSNTKTTQYFPVESNKTFLGLSGGLQYTDKVNYHAGINLSGERLGLTVFTNPLDLKQLGIQLNTKLIKIKD